MPRWVCNDPQRGAVISEIITVGLDLAKNVFQVHGSDGSGRAVLRKKLRRDQVLDFFGRLPLCVVAMEACGGAHFWGREITKLSHEVRLIPPVYVKPFVKRQKNDAADAEAICEAALRPTMRFVPVKSQETQGAAMVYRIRELLIRQRTQAINALRGHLGEFGQIVPQGAGKLARKLGRYSIQNQSRRVTCSALRRWTAQRQSFPAAIIAIRDLNLQGLRRASQSSRTSGGLISRISIVKRGN